MSYATPADLANHVLSHLSQRLEALPPRDAIVQLFEVMYCCSISKEEAEGISFHVVYLEPENTEPNPLKKLPSNWQLIKLETPIAVNFSNIKKLAPATDPRSSALAVYHDVDNHPIVMGFVDQINSYDDFINMEISSGQRMPGIFQSRVNGPGHISVNIGYEKIAELQISMITSPQIDVFEEGPIYNGLTAGLNPFLAEMRTLYPEIMKTRMECVAEFYWLSCIKRVLLRMKNFRHGGAILIVPERSIAAELNIKFKLRYSRLCTAIKTFFTLLLKYDDFHKKLDFDPNFKIDINEMRQWYIEYFFWDRESSEQELKATIWFISLLSRIDGLVLMTPHLEVIGFGTEIMVPEEPQSIKKAFSAIAEPDNMRDR